MTKTVAFLDKNNNIIEEIEIPDDQYAQMEEIAKEYDVDVDVLIREAVIAMLDMESDTDVDT